jgi:hypothetical protein
MKKVVYSVFWPLFCDSASLAEALSNSTVAIPACEHCENPTKSHNVEQNPPNDGISVLHPCQWSAALQKINGHVDTLHSATTEGHHHSKKITAIAFNSALFNSVIIINQRQSNRTTGHEYACN